MKSETQRLFEDELRKFEYARKRMLLENTDVLMDTGKRWAIAHARHHVLTCGDCLRFTHVYMKEHDGVRNTRPGV